MIEHLKNLGLTEIESRCYLALYEKNNQTGYEVAKNLGISRSNVYASLQSLEQKGGCISSGDTKTTYTAVPIRDFLNILRMDFKKSSRFLRRELAKSKASPFEMKSVQGEEKVLNLITQTLMSAENTLIIESPNHALEKINPILQELEIEYEHSEAAHISIMSDEKAVFIGTLDEESVPSGLLTYHPSLVSYFKDSFNNKKMIQAIQKQLGPEFLDQFE